MTGSYSQRRMADRSGGVRDRRDMDFCTKHWLIVVYVVLPFHPTLWRPTWSHQNPLTIPLRKTQDSRYELVDCFLDAGDCPRTLSRLGSNI